MTWAALRSWHNAFTLTRFRAKNDSRRGYRRAKVRLTISSGSNPSAPFAISSDRGDNFFPRCSETHTTCKPRNRCLEWRPSRKVPNRIWKSFEEILKFLQNGERERERPRRAETGEKDGWRKGGRSKRIKRWTVAARRISQDGWRPTAAPPSWDLDSKWRRSLRQNGARFKKLERSELKLEPMSNKSWDLNCRWRKYFSLGGEEWRKL